MHIDITHTVENPLIRDDGMSHWQCSIPTGSEPLSFVVSFDSDIYGGRPPSRTDVVALLAADIETTLDRTKGRWMDDFCSDDDNVEERERAYGEIGRIREGLTRAFGPQVIDDLISGHLDADPVDPVYGAHIIG